MEDLVGMGKAVEKFLELVRSSVGTVYRPRAIRNEGKAKADAKAYELITLAKAESDAIAIRDDAERSLAERAVMRLRHQETLRQANIESIVEQALPHIDGKEISEEVDKDWLFYMFESCAGISDSDVQKLWSKVLAEKLTSSPGISRKMIDCLRWIDSRLALQFVDWAPRLYIHDGFFSDEVKFKNRQLSSISFPYDTDALEEAGLVKEFFGKIFDFKCFSLDIECQELTDRSVEYRGFFELTPTWEALAQIVCPSISAYRELIKKSPAGSPRKVFSSYHGYSYGRERVKAESLLFKPEKRAKMVAEQLVHLIYENPIKVMISKGIIIKDGKYNLHTSGEVLILENRTGLDRRLSAVRVLNERHWSALAPAETHFLDELIKYIEANNGTVETVKAKAR